MAAQSLQVHTDQLVFTKSTAERYSVLALNVFFVLIALVVGVLGPMLDPINSDHNLLVFRLLPIVCLIGLCFGLAFSGPRTLHIDPHTRTYTYTAGLPLLAKTVHGPLTDIKTFVLRATQYRGGATTNYQLEIEWNLPNRKTATIAAMNLAKSYEVQDQFKLRLNIPVRWEEL